MGRPQKAPREKRPLGATSTKPRRDYKVHSSPPPRRLLTKPGKSKPSWPTLITPDNTSSIDQDEDVSPVDSSEGGSDDDNQQIALWGNITRPDARDHTVKGENVDLFEATKAVLLTRIMTGSGLEELSLQELSPWPEHHTNALSRVMIKIWRDQKRKLYTGARSIRVISGEPTGMEARKVPRPPSNHYRRSFGTFLTGMQLFDSLSDFRSFLMKKVREVVASYLESHMMSPEALKGFVSDLLLDLRFTRRRPEDMRDMVC